MTYGAATTAIVVPVKTFGRAKSRLIPVLSGPQRRSLARAMSTSVLAAAAPLPCFVVSGSPDVARWAITEGANVIWYQPDDNLNRAVAFAAERLGRDGFERLVVAHGDLPLARDLASPMRAEPSEVVAVADRHGRGTNVLSVPLSAGFDFRYGPGSLDAHRREAERLGLRWRVVDDPALAWDVDEPTDLTALAFG